MESGKTPLTYDMPKVICPTCGTGLDAATNLTDETAPKAGDITICGYCQTIAEFTGAGQLVTLSQEKLDSLPPEVRGVLSEVVAECRKLFRSPTSTARASKRV